MRRKMALAEPKIIPGKEKSGFGKRSKKRKIRVPKFSKEAKTLAYCRGKIAIITLPPSKGGTGIRLKIARTRLSKQTLARSWVRPKLVGTILAVKANRMAKTKLVAGPAKPINPMSFLGLLKL